MMLRCLTLLCLSISAVSLPLQAAEQMLLTMPEPPVGMTVSKAPLTLDDEIIGYHVQVADEEGVSKVIVQIETIQDRTGQEARVDGLKSYVNGLANGLKNAGFKLESNEVPNLKTANFDRQLQVNMQFAKEDQTRLFVRQFIYFNDKGYNVQVLAADQEELEQLSDWAQHIRPARWSVSIPTVRKKPVTAEISKPKSEGKQLATWRKHFTK